MKSKTLVAVALLSGVLSAPLRADEAERFDHYQGERPGDLSSALTLLDDFAQRLQQQLANDNLDPVVLNEIHQLTYTLENALGRLSTDVAELAELLESVHVASETAGAATVREDGERFLQQLAPLLRQ